MSLLRQKILLDGIVRFWVSLGVMPETLTTTNLRLRVILGCVPETHMSTKKLLAQNKVAIQEA